MNCTPQGAPLCHNCHHVLPNRHISRVPSQFYPNQMKTIKPTEGIFETVANQKLTNFIGNVSGGAVSIEELVKMVVSAVKETGVLNKNEKKNNKEETPATILQRKRQQVNILTFFNIACSIFMTGHF